VRVATLAASRVVRAVDAEAVALAGLDAGQVAVPDERVDLGQRDAPLVEDRVLSTDIEAVAALIDDGTLAAAVEKVVGPLEPA